MKVTLDMPTVYGLIHDESLLLEPWLKTMGVELPNAVTGEVSARVDDAFQKVFPGFLSIDGRNLIGQIEDLPGFHNVPVVSLDGSFVKSPLKLEFTRLVDPLGHKLGIGPRPGTPPVVHQFDALEQQIKTGPELRTVSLFDDILYTGTQVLDIRKELGRRGIHVESMFAGVGISEGMERLEGAGIEVHCVHTFDSATAHIINMANGADFMPGVPGGGKKTPGGKQIPYIFGDLKTWAEINPYDKAGIVKTGLEAGLQIFTALERASDRDLYNGELPTPIQGVEAGQRLISFFKRRLEEIG